MHVSFCVWVNSLSIMSSKLIHLISELYSFYGWKYSSVCIYHILFVIPSVNRYWVLFLPFYNSKWCLSEYWHLSIYLESLFWIFGGGYIPWSGIIGLCVNSCLIFRGTKYTVLRLRKKKFTLVVPFSFPPVKSF